jgi:hypothetical protein
MILETALGSLFGGALRLAPEVLKWLDRKSEREHEIKLQDLSLQASREKAEQQLRAAEQQRGAVLDAGAMTALVESIKAQAQPTGIRWVDALNALVRPGVTYCYFGLYVAARVAAFVLAVQAGAAPLDVLAKTWTAEDQAMLSSILSFWFLNRTLEKAGR